MKKNSYFRWGLVLFFVLLSALYVLPTAIDLENLPEDERPWYAAILPNKQLKLGLDLKGGIHLVLGVDVDKAVDNRAAVYATDLREFLDAEEVKTVSVEKAFKGSAIVVVLDNVAAKEDLLRLVETRFNIIELDEQDDNALTYEFTIKKDERRIIEKETIAQALETLRNRVDEFGVSEPQISTQGKDRIIIQLPGMKDPDRARALLGKTAQLTFQLVSDDLNAVQLNQFVVDAKKELAAAGNENPNMELINYHLRDRLPKGTEIMYGEVRDRSTAGQTAETIYLVESMVLLTGDKLEDARASVGGDFNQPQVNFRLNPSGATIFEKVTRENAKRRLGIILDDKVSSAPTIEGPIPGGRGQITMGSLADRQSIMQEARDLAMVLRAGALPAPVDILENRSVGPSLGSDSVSSGQKALLMGGILVVIFMLLYYRGSGVVADVVLAINVLFMLAILAGFQAVLTLPGIAGLVLTIGMAVDANIIIFERIREELGIGKDLLEAVRTGFSRAHLTILDANVTTMIAGIVLLQYGTGPVKGFAVTLIIGILTSYVTAIWVARLFFDFLIRRDLLTSTLFQPKRS